MTAVIGRSETLELEDIVTIYEMCAITIELQSALSSS